MCKVQKDASLSLASHYLSSCTATSISAMQPICEIWANGWYERHCTCLSTSASASPLLTCGSHQDFDCMEWVLTGGSQHRRLTENTDRIQNSPTITCISINWHGEEWRLRKEHSRTEGHTTHKCKHNWNNRGIGHTSCKNTPTHVHTHAYRSQNRTHSDALVPLSKVWLHIGTTDSLLRICPGAQTLVCSIDLSHVTQQNLFIIVL